MFVNILLYISYFIFLYYFLINATYIFLIVISFRRLKEYIKQSRNDLYVENSTTKKKTKKKQNQKTHKKPTKTKTQKKK